MTIVTTDAALRDRGLALALTASCLGRRVEPLLDDDHLTSLIDTVSRVDAIRFGDALPRPSITGADRPGPTPRR